MPFIALLDANTLYSESIRDILLRAVEFDLFRPLWSQDILSELARNLKRSRSEEAALKIDRLIAVMQDAFSEARVEGYQDLIPLLHNHPKDRHVLAAAIRGRADLVVTWNARDFPTEACAPFGISVQNPDQFLCSLWSISPESLGLILRQRSEHMRRPPSDLVAMVNRLRQTVPAFTELALQSGLP